MEKLNAKETSSQEGATKPLYFMWWVAWGLIALCFMVFTVKYYLESSKLAGTGRVQSQTNWILRNIGEGGILNFVLYLNYFKNKLLTYSEIRKNHLTGF